MKPNCGILASLAVATVCLTTVATTPAARAQLNANGAELITNGPQTGPGDRSGAQSAAQNVRDSDRYESVLRSNPNYRAARESKECGPIEDPAMRANCLATFDR